MISWFLAFAACVVVVTADADAESTTNGTNSRFSWCEMPDDNLYRAMDACFQMEAELIRNATASCVSEIWEESNGSLVDFVHAACKDISLFLKLDECYAEYRTDEEFQEQEEIDEETYACYLEVYEKYNLED